MRTNPNNAHLRRNLPTKVHCMRGPATADGQSEEPKMPADRPETTVQRASDKLTQPGSSLAHGLLVLSANTEPHPNRIVGSGSVYTCKSN